jgi:carbon starvation protein
MLLEGALAVLVILACSAGIGMGRFERTVLDGGGIAYTAAVSSETGEALTGRDAWSARYQADSSWRSFTLGAKVGAFIEGGANFLRAIGIPLKMGICIIAVLVASFAATTLDTATRLQRYVVQELAATVGCKPLSNRYLATGVALGLGGGMALVPASATAGPGSGGLILWPMFGATNQMLAGLAFLVIAFYLRRRSKPIAFALLPAVALIVVPAWAMLWNMFNPESGWWQTSHHLLFGMGFGILLLQGWIVVEAILLWPRVEGVLEEPLPSIPDGISPPPL